MNVVRPLPPDFTPREPDPLSLALDGILGRARLWIAVHRRSPKLTRFRLHASTLLPPRDEGTPSAWVGDHVVDARVEAPPYLPYRGMICRALAQIANTVWFDDGQLREVGDRLVNASTLVGLAATGGLMLERQRTREGRSFVTVAHPAHEVGKPEADWAEAFELPRSSAHCPILPLGTMPDAGPFAFPCDGNNWHRAVAIGVTLDRLRARVLEGPDRPTPPRSYECGH
jgi:hypothetical protein